MMQKEHEMLRIPCMAKCVTVQVKKIKSIMDKINTNRKHYAKGFYRLFHSIFSALLNLPYPMNNRALIIAVNL